MGRRKTNSKSKLTVYVIFACIICFIAIFGISDKPSENSGGIIEQNAITNITEKLVSISDIPEYSGSPYIAINKNVPFFEDSELTTNSFESYSEQDSLGRCGTAVASVGKDIMPTEDRGSIGSVKPTGWHTVKYDGIDGVYLYNRCHLIGYQLTGENANIQNLITGTRYMNVEGMLPFEKMVADYVKETNNHVMYRVTPVFEENNLLASGVVIEAKSVEDDGEGILFNVYCYNVQPGIEIDYATGESKIIEESEEENITTSTPIISSAVATVVANNNSTTTTISDSTDANTNATQTKNEVEHSYVLNTNTKRFHYTSCSNVKQMSEKNKKDYTGTRDEVISMGYKSCGRCNP